MLTARDVPDLGLDSGQDGPTDGRGRPQAQAWSRAREMAEDGSLHQVRRPVLSFEEGSAGDTDCFMTAALSRLQRLGRAGASEVFALCGASGVYRGMCVSQFIDDSGAASPPADVGDTLNWAPVLMRAHDLRELSDDPRLREEVLDRFWSSVALHSVYAARGLSGDALDALPLAARGHLRAALALRVVTSAEDDLSITDAQRLVSTVLDRRIDGDGVAVSGLPPGGDRPLAVRWPRRVSHCSGQLPGTVAPNRRERSRDGSDPECAGGRGAVGPAEDGHAAVGCAAPGPAGPVDGSQAGRAEGERPGPNLILHLEGPARRTEVRDRIQ